MFIHIKMMKKHLHTVKGEVKVFKVWFNLNLTFQAGSEWSLRCLGVPNILKFPFLTGKFVGFYNTKVH